MKKTFLSLLTSNACSIFHCNVVFLTYSFKLYEESSSLLAPLSPTTAWGCSFPTFKLPLCVDDAQIRWNRVKAAAANHIHALGRGLGMVLQLHSLQELTIQSHTEGINAHSSHRTKCEWNPWDSLPHLRLATDVQVVSSVCNTGLDHRFSIEPVLRRQSQPQLEMAISVLIFSKLAPSSVGPTHRPDTVQNHQASSTHGSQRLLLRNIGHNDLHLRPELRHGWWSTQ